MSQNAQIAAGLRKAAEELRKKAVDVEKEKIEKCAHVLIAAHGLNCLKNIITNPGGQ